MEVYMDLLASGFCVGLCSWGFEVLCVNGVVG